MSKSIVSVIIPCHNQVSALTMALQSLENQTLPGDQFEVIIIDDGSTDNTREVISSLNTTYLLKYIFQERSGASIARNKGASLADAELLIFLDADMICDPEFLISHLHAHANSNSMMVEGCRKPWRNGRKELYYKILDIDMNEPLKGLDRAYFAEMLTCNLSIKKQIFDAIGGFDPQIARVEDIDFAYRAKQSGVLFGYEPQAIAYHHHPLSFQEYCHKQQRTHQFFRDLSKKHPGILTEIYYLSDRLEINSSQDSCKLILRKLIRRFLALPVSLKTMEICVRILEKFCPWKYLLGKLYRAIFASYQLKGLRSKEIVMPV